MPSSDEARAEAERRWPHIGVLSVDTARAARRRSFIQGVEWERNRPISNYEVNDVALALYKLDHPAYDSDTFEDVPLLSTVQHYRERARAALEAARGTKQ